MTEKDFPQLIFVVGPPASGKTTICKELLRILNRAGIKTSYISDGEVLREICNEDVFHSRHQVNDGVVVIGESVRHEIYERLASLVPQNKKNEFVIVEIATNEWDMAFSYYRPEHLHQAFLIQVRSSLTECLERNRQRHQQNPHQFNMFVPEAFIATFFTHEEKRDPFLKFTQNFVLENSGISIENLTEKIREFAQRFFGTHNSKPDALSN